MIKEIRIVKFYLLIVVMSNNYFLSKYTIDIFLQLIIKKCDKKNVLLNYHLLGIIIHSFLSVLCL